MDVNLLQTEQAEIPHQPNLTIKTTGNPQNAVSYINPRAFPAGLMELPRDMSRQADSLSGNPESLRATGGTGLVRGGQGALEALLQTVGKRTIGIAEEIEPSMKQVYEKILIGHKYL